MTNRRLLRRLLAVPVGLACVLALGCGLSKPFERSTRFFKQTMAPGGTDREHWADEQADPWIEEAGVEARGDRARQKDPDPWFKNYLMSEKARSIERNLGID
jgi:hypothetical protein